MLQRCKTFHPKLKNTDGIKGWNEESLAVNMKPAAAGINQQGHTELLKRLRASVKAVVDTSNVL